MIRSEVPARAGQELRRRYTTADLRVFTPDEASRFVPHGDGDPQTDMVLAWELLYRLEPELYDRLASVERLHPDVLGWLPHGVDRSPRSARAGTADARASSMAGGGAVEPALPLRQILRRKLTTADHGNRARVIHGFFDELPLPDGFADLVIACSAFTPSSGHGGEVGLSEMERVCRPGGCVAVIWPNNIDWLATRGYRYVCFDGPMCVEFSSHEEAVELAGIFFPRAAEDVARRGLRQVPFEVLRINPPRDLAFKVLAQ